MVINRRQTAAVTVSATRRALSEAEKETLLPDLVERGISPAMLDIIPPNGRFFQLLRATDHAGNLLGVTSLMSVRPFVSLKQNLGEGNHVGWDTSIYFARGADRPAVTAALLQAMAQRSFYFAMYFGRIDDDVEAAMWATAFYFSAMWAVFFYYVFPAPGVTIRNCLVCFFGTGLFSVSLLKIAYYLMGRFSTEGWWYYFLVAFLIKTPLPMLASLVVTFVVMRRRRAATALVPKVPQAPGIESPPADTISVWRECA